ncbi:metallophosphoesterase [Yersinia enterocolitica]|nr:metallophosphoesterase [Yersinia enterocolitica]
MTRYAFIGDIHGQYSKLQALLTVLKTESSDWFYVFVGDLIDNKKGITDSQLETLETVKALVDSKKAICLMGNHEFNAVGCAMRHQKTGKPLRPHTENNRKQHQAFLDAVTENSALHQQWINWFKGLPLYADFGAIRAVHACWDEAVIEAIQPYLKANNAIAETYWETAFEKHSPLYNMTETLLKGPELALPEGVSFNDKTGLTRKNIRMRWWLPQAETYRELAQVPPDAESLIPNIPLNNGYSPLDLGVPVVIGHYTLHGQPQQLSKQVICTDYNAAKDDHPLVAYCCTVEGEYLSSQGFISSTGNIV